MQPNKFRSNNIINHNLIFGGLSDLEDRENHDQLPLNQQSLEQVNLDELDLDVLDRMYMEDSQEDDDYQEDPTIIIDVEPQQRDMEYYQINLEFINLLNYPPLLNQQLEQILDELNLDSSHDIDMEYDHPLMFRVDELPMPQPQQINDSYQNYLKSLEKNNDNGMGK